jgi:hypothetical protein
MNLHSRRHRPVVVDQSTSPSAGGVLWHHPAFCRIGLPLRAPRATWKRTVEAASVTIEPGTAGLALPAGELLRSLLLFICDTALTTGDPSIDLGEDADVLASWLGRRSKERALREQIERILAATITVSVDGGPHRAFLDRRSLPRSAEGVWRSSVRLGAGFHAGLIESAIPLDRAVVEMLRDAPMALDAYAWIRQALHRREPGKVVRASWSNLHAAFATASQDLHSFTPLFEAALRRAAEADPAMRLQVTSDEVCLATVASDAGGRHDDQPTTKPRPSTTSSDVTTPAAAQAAAASLPKEAELPKPVGAPPGEDREEVHGTPPPPKDRAASLRSWQAVPKVPAQPAPVPETVSLRSELTGLPQVIWLRRGYGVDSALVGVTPSARFDADHLTLLAVEPLVMQVSGGLPTSEFDQISAWILINRDLIDDIWAGQVRSLEEISQRVRKAPPPGWR